MKFARQTTTINCVILLMTLTTAGAPSIVAAHEGEESGSEPAVLSEEAQQVVDTLNGYARAVESTDLQKIEGYMVADDGFSSIEGTFTDIGWQSYRDHLAPEIAMFENTKYQLRNIRPYVSGDMAYASFDYAMDVTVVSDQFESGEHPVSMRGKGTVILIKDREDWKIRHLHTVTKREVDPENTTEH